jgi:DNA-binding SARP family transcriptional activator/tetratricopeptide (TPR) repeat protein
VELKVLGSFEVIDRNSGASIPIPSKKARALLGILTTAPKYTASRARLAALLWSDSAEEQARQSLRQLLSNLRRSPQPGSNLVIFDESTVRLNETFLCIDVQRLLSQPSTPDISASMNAISAYRGPFGQGLETGELDFDNWLTAERQRIDEHVITLRDQLVRNLASAGRHQEALAQSTALLAMSPLREETHRLIIEQEAIVSGRASAMQRFEAFRIMLRDELAVRPEPATIRLIDRLRSPPPDRTEPASPPDVGNGEDRHEATHQQTIDQPRGPSSDGLKTRRRVSLMLAAACIALLGSAVALFYGTLKQNAVEYAGEAFGRASVALLPFEGSASDDSFNSLKDVLNREATLAFSRNNRVTLIDVSDGRVGRARYQVKTFLSNKSRADVSLVTSDSGHLIWSASIPVDDGPPTKFARELYGSVFSEIVLHQAQLASAGDQASPQGMLWRARAAQLQTRLGNEDPTAIELYKAVLTKEPNNPIALLGLSDCLILRVARNQSSNRPADIAEARDLLIRVKPLVPNSSDIAFKEGMLSKLQGQFERASTSFEQAMRLDPAHWNAAAQYAHVMIFLGRIEEGFALMASVASNLLPDLGAAETAYIAGETALAAGHTDEAVRYLNMAVSGNPTVGRIHALHAAALELANRADEARAAADQARILSPQYTPEIMAQRGGPNASPRYVKARQRMVEGFRTARLTSMPLR